MSLINPDLSGIVDGSVADAGAWVTPMTTIINAINGNLDSSNLSTSASILFSQLAATPFGTFAPAPTGFTGGVNVGEARYQVIGKICLIRLEFDGTSNATTCTFTLPFSAKNSGRIGIVPVLNNGSWIPTGVLSTTVASTTATLNTDPTGSGFASSNGKGFDGVFWYEIA